MIETQEVPEVRPVERPPDPVSLVVGCAHFVQNHRTTLQLQGEFGRSPRLAVSRYYWDIEPPVAVDFVRNLRFGEPELEAKKAYFKEQGVLYALARDPMDGEGVQEWLARQASPEKSASVPQGKKPQTGPRRER